MGYAGAKKASMLQDVSRGIPSEVGVINGWVLRGSPGIFPGSSGLRAPREHGQQLADVPREVVSG